MCLRIVAMHPKNNRPKQPCWTVKAAAQARTIDRFQLSSLRSPTLRSMNEERACDSRSGVGERSEPHEENMSKWNWLKRHRRLESLARIWPISAELPSCFGISFSKASVGFVQQSNAESTLRLKMPPSLSHRALLPRNARTPQHVQQNTSHPQGRLQKLPC